MMRADFAKCPGERVRNARLEICPFRNRCLRYTAEPAPAQTWVLFWRADAIQFNEDCLIEAPRNDKT